jgi:hypothetical protein
VVIDMDREARLNLIDELERANDASILEIETRRAARDFSDLDDEIEQSTISNGPTLKMTDHLKSAAPATPVAAPADWSAWHSYVDSRIAAAIAAERELLRKVVGAALAIVREECRVAAVTEIRGALDVGADVVTPWPLTKEKKNVA